MYSQHQSQHWPPCHKRPCPALVTFCLTVQLSPSWFMFSIWKRFLDVPAITYCITKVQSCCLWLTAALEQVNPLLQKDYCCVICQKSWLQYLSFKYWQNIVSFIQIWHVKAFLWQTCLSLLLFLLLALFFCLSGCLSCSLSQSLSLLWLQMNRNSKTWLPTWVVTKLKCKHGKIWSLRLKRSCRMEDVSMSVFFQSIASKPAPPSLPPGTFT